MHAVFSRQDTYTLLNSIATTTLSSGGTTATSTQNSVTYDVPSQARIITVNTGETQLEVLATAASQGFFVMIPTANIRTNVDGTATAQVPVSSIPTDVQVPVSTAAAGGPLTDVFTSTGPVILSPTAPVPRGLAPMRPGVFRDCG